LHKCVNRVALHAIWENACMLFAAKLRLSINRNILNHNQKKKTLELCISGSSVSRN
jgi:hypothetical protein